MRIECDVVIDEIRVEFNSEMINQVWIKTYEKGNIRGGMWLSKQQALDLADKIQKVIQADEQKTIDAYNALKKDI